MKGASINSSLPNGQRIIENCSNWLISPIPSINSAISTPFRFILFFIPSQFLSSNLNRSITQTPLRSLQIWELPLRLRRCFNLHASTIHKFLFHPLIQVFLFLLFSMPLRKHESGSKKRKRKEKQDNLIRSQTGALDKFVIKKTLNSVENQNVDANDMSAQCLNDQNVDANDVSGQCFNDIHVNANASNAEHNDSFNLDEAGNNENEDFNVVDCDASITISLNSHENDVSDSDDVCTSFHGLDIFDPRVWDSLDSKMIDVLATKGPKRDLSIKKGPKNKLSRRFTATCYTRILANGETCDRDWLVYSKELDRIFCFCCKIFKKSCMLSQLTNEGFDDWSHLSARLKEHETGLEHVKNMSTWCELRLRLQKHQCIDKVAQSLLEKEKKHWKDVLKRIVAAVKFLAKYNLPFRGSNEKLYQKSNGNFLGIFEMLAEFDPVIKEHVHRIINNEINVHYLSPKIQNEIICMLAARIKSNMIQKVEHSKYFSILLDCTPDVSHQEQMSLILRYVNISSSDSVTVEELFLGFLEVNDTTGLGLFDALQNELKSLDLDIDNVRGQGYDNGSNMKGKHQGVQKRLLDINPRAFYSSCACHSLNLTLCDIANTCAKARDFFGAIQRIYTLFANSVKRWKIFKDNVSGLTVKSLSATRWESRIDSVKAIRYQVLEIREALLEVVETDREPNDAQALVDKLCDFEFIISLVIWYEMLNVVNLVSKHLQSKNMLIDVAIEKVKGLISFFENFRETGFLNALDTAKEIAIELNIDPIFPQKRKIQRKKHFDETSSSNDVIAQVPQSAQEVFRVEYFLCIVDQAIVSLNKRFEQYQEFENIFGFLFTSEKLRSLDDVCLKSSCYGIENALKKHDQLDINGTELNVELKSLRDFLPNKNMGPLDILQFLKQNDCFPNAMITYRILLTIPVTVASAERSFSKLKLLKSYMRSTMSQERLSGLAIIAIESDTLKEVDYDELIEDFASKTVRRASLFK